MNEKIYFPSLRYSPEVHFHQGTLLIQGSSVAQDVSSVYKKIIEALKDSSIYKSPEINVRIHLDYLNSQTMRALTEILLICKEIRNNGKRVVIYWNYQNEDDGIFESGHILEDITEMPIRFEKKEKASAH